jgi:hypothetical protein
MSMFEEGLRFDETFLQLVLDSLAEYQQKSGCCPAANRKRVLRLREGLCRTIKRPYGRAERSRFPPHGNPLLPEDKPPYSLPNLPLRRKHRQSRIAEQVEQIARNGRANEEMKRVAQQDQVIRGRRRAGGRRAAAGPVTVVPGFDTIVEADVEVVSSAASSARSSASRRSAPREPHSTSNPRADAAGSSGLPGGQQRQGPFRDLDPRLNHVANAKSSALHSLGGLPRRGPPRDPISTPKPTASPAGSPSGSPGGQQPRSPPRDRHATPNLETNTVSPALHSLTLSDLQCQSPPRNVHPAPNLETNIVPSALNSLTPSEIPHPSPRPEIG